MRQVDPLQLRRRLKLRVSIHKILAKATERAQRAHESHIEAVNRAAISKRRAPRSTS